MNYLTLRDLVSSGEVVDVSKDGGETTESTNHIDVCGVLY